jgi:hypothetical protein
VGKVRQTLLLIWKRLRRQAQAQQQDQEMEEQRPRKKQQGCQGRGSRRSSAVEGTVVGRPLTCRRERRRMRHLR